MYKYFYGVYLFITPRSNHFFFCSTIFFGVHVFFWSIHFFLEYTFFFAVHIFVWSIDTFFGVYIFFGEHT